MLEKWWVNGLGECFNCLEVCLANSRAKSSPITVTTMAIVLAKGGSVITGVLKGVKMHVINSPATMLPQASRASGLRIAGSFSLIARRGENRGWPIVT